MSTTEELTPDQFLAEAESFAALLYGPEKLAVLLRTDVADIRLAISDPRSPLGSAIHRGYLLCESEIRVAVLKSAKQGSGPAQAEALRLLKSIGS